MDEDRKHLMSVVVRMLEEDEAFFEGDGCLKSQRALAIIHSCSRELIGCAIDYMRQHHGMEKRGRRYYLKKPVDRQKRAPPRHIEVGAPTSDMDFDELMQIRTVLEACAAARAATNFVSPSPSNDLITARDIFLDRSNAVENAYKHSEGELIADSELHESIYHLARADNQRNYTFEIYLVISQPIWAHVSHNRKGLATLCTYRDDTLHQHNEIIEAIKNGNPSLASEAARSHMDYVRRAFLIIGGGGRDGDGG